VRVNCIYGQTHFRLETVYVMTRSDKHGADFARLGAVPIVADVTQPCSMVKLPTVDTVLYSVGFDRTAGQSIRQVYVEGLANTLAALPSATGKFIYVSSTGVYAQDDGSWVDEQSPCEPEREGGKACLAAEQLLQAHPLGTRSIILRMAGLYGPDRIPFQRELRAGTPLAVSVDGYLNLIHIDDAASVVLAADRVAKPPATYTVSDGQPVVRRDYYEHLAGLLGAPSPTFTAPAADRRSDRASTNKRVSNQRMLKELGVTLAHPSYREGLQAILVNQHQ
jgi:nucleoside-diphosphate-sugar epimerase